MTQILKEGGKTIIKTDSRIDTMNANQFEADIQPALKDGGVDLEMDCSELTYMASSGLRIIQKTMRTVMQQRGQFKMTNVSPEIYKVLAMTGFTKFMKVEQKKGHFKIINVNPEIYKVLAMTGFTKFMKVEQKRVQEQ